MLLLVVFKQKKKKELFLKILASAHHFVKLPPVQEAERYRQALKEAVGKIPVAGLTDTGVIIIQIASVAFCALTSLWASKL